MEDTSEFAYYHAIKEQENKNYEEAISKLDAIIEIKNNNKLVYWAKYWRGCTYLSWIQIRNEKENHLQTLLSYC